MTTSENGERNRRTSPIVTDREVRHMATVDHGGRKRCSYKNVDSPVGRLTLAATDEGLAGIIWESERPGRVRLALEVEDNVHPVLVETERQLAEYFAGQRKTFAVKLDLAGTAFQRKVWSALLTIPFGETRSYGQIARQIGTPGAARAVGAANGSNPLPIIAPCHRVIGSSGRLTGFGGGLDAKARLLELEGARQARQGRPGGRPLPTLFESRVDQRAPRPAQATTRSIRSSQAAEE
jgi:methylated-DNA-[protein]-cysteine S-methyltransferase